MPLFGDAHQSELREAGWHSRGYLPHSDGRALPQFITFHLADSIPLKVIQRWREELKSLKEEQKRILMQRRIERYLDQGYGEALLKVPQVATMVQDSLLNFDGSRYRLFAWVVMPNHVHSLMTRSEELELSAFFIRLSRLLLMRQTKYWIDRDSSGSKITSTDTYAISSILIELLST
jgi:hypothetical protein